MRFRATLLADPTGTGTYVAVPSNVKNALGLKGRPKIHAVIAGHPYRGSLMPAGDGRLLLGVLKSIQQAEGLKRGDTITIELELDTALESSSRRPTWLRRFGATRPPLRCGSACPTPTSARSRSASRRRRNLRRAKGAWRPPSLGCTRDRRD